MNKFILGILATVGFLMLESFATSIDTIGAMSGKTPLFWWLTELKWFIPTVLVGYLFLLGVASFLKEEEQVKNVK